MLRALTVTGGVITSAGILLAAVFAVLGVLPLVALAQLGTIICVGVLLDTLVVRTMLVPGDRGAPRRPVLVAAAGGTWGPASLVGFPGPPGNVTSWASHRPGSDSSAWRSPGVGWLRGRCPQARTHRRRPTKKVRAGLAHDDSHRAVGRRPAQRPDLPAQEPSSRERSQRPHHQTAGRPKVSSSRCARGAYADRQNHDTAGRRGPSRAAARAAFQQARTDVVAVATPPAFRSTTRRPGGSISRTSTSRDPTGGPAATRPAYASTAAS